MVDISISASPTLLIEEENTATTLTLQLSEPPPADGLIVPFDVSIDSGAPDPLAQFNLQNFSFEGAELDTVNTDTLDEFALAVNAQTVRIRLIVGNDSFDEGVDEVTFSLRETPDFNIIPDAGETTLTIVDDETLIPEEPDRDRVTLTETDSPVELELREQSEAVETESRNQLASVELRESDLVFDTLTSFLLTNVPEGDAVEVGINLPDNQAANGYFNFDPEENNWFEFVQPEITIENQQIILNLVDGGDNDLDGETNGEILSIGSPVFIPQVALAPETDPSIALETIDQTEEIETESRNQLASVGLRENNLVFESLTSFVVTNLSLGESVEVEITIPENQKVSNYFNFDPETDRWFELIETEENGEISKVRIEDDKITLNLVDGGVGDLDGEVNGEITNIGSPILIPQGGQITPSPEAEKILNVVTPPNEKANIAHQVTARDNSNTVFEIGYTLLNEEQSLPETPQEKLDAVNNGASLFSVYPNTFENGEPGQFDFFNFGFENATNPLERIISIENNTRLAYYLIEGKNVTSDTVNANNIGQVQFDFLEVSNSGDQFTLAGENVTFTAETVTEEDTELPKGTNLQTEAGLEVFDLRENTGTVTATLGFDLISAAGFDNLIGFYTVVDETGNITTGNRVIAPGQAGYTEAALANSRQNFGNDAILNRDAAQGDTFTVPAGEIIVPFILVQGGDLNEIPSELPEEVEAYFPYLGANDDGADHFRILADNTFGVEDLNGGGDRDFNDIIFQLDFA